MFGSAVGRAVVGRCLGGNMIDLLPPLVRRRKRVMYSVGQPLAFHSSWPLFALAHHFVVWLAADRVYPGVRFRAYAILGDDLVIADTKVATSYQEIRRELDVEISYEDRAASRLSNERKRKAGGTYEATSAGKSRPVVQSRKQELPLKFR